jgi:hypothetical protein
MNSKMNTDKFPVIINRAYSGYYFSNTAIEEYKKKCPYSSDKIKFIRGEYCVNIDRSDPIMLQIVTKLGQSASSDLSKLEIKYINKEFSNCYEITEYDGFEGVVINFEKYKLDKITEILNKDISSDEKITLINIIMKTKINDII